MHVSGCRWQGATGHGYYSLMKKILLLMCTLLALSGCSSFVPKLEAPELSIVNVQLVSSTMWEQTLKVRMRVQNPNDRVLPVKGLSYKLEVADQDLAEGVSAAAFTVPALG